MVINEIMYHAPDSGTNPNVEFLELYNRGAAAVDVSGWTISDAAVIDTVDHRIPANTVLPSHAFFLIADGLAPGGKGFTDQFPGITPDLRFVAGSNLSNGGEPVTLVDTSDNVVDSVTYDDAAPWPVSPDGTSGSLELVDPFSDNSLGDGWRASAGDYGTPKAQNSVFGTSPGDITNVIATPPRPNPNASFTVQATMPRGLAATLTYKVMFGTDRTTAFTDGANSVGGANDGTYSAVVPGAPAGQLIRFKISADNSGTPLTYPRSDDTRGYDGVVVADPSLNNASLPVLEWFLPDADYNALLRPVCDDVNYSGVITWQGHVFDNATFRRRGHGSCTDPKPKIEMQLPPGYSVDFNATLPPGAVMAQPFTGPIDEWALQNETYPIPGLGWQNIAAIGDPPNGYLPVRSQHNATFFGAGAILEEYDGAWRQREGYNNSAFYKVEAGGFRTYATPAQLLASGDFAKKNPDDNDYTDAWQLTQMLNQGPSAAKTAWMLNNIDVAEV
ncbi:MAG TPA: lamin tail domain-containing protein, partial [Nocardioidaceae bacterium]